MKKLLYNTLIIIAILVIIINVMSANNKSIFGFRIYRVVSGSMNPYLKIGDFIIIKKQNKYDTGDIITYDVNHEYVVTHRIVLINGDEIITKGDANNTNDNPIIEQQIVGKVIFKIRSINYIRYLLTKPLIWILILIIGIITIILFSSNKEEKRKRRHRRRRKKERKE